QFSPCLRVCGCDIRFVRVGTSPHPTAVAVGHPVGGISVVLAHPFKEGGDYVDLHSGRKLDHDRVHVLVNSCVRKTSFQRHADIVQHGSGGFQRSTPRNSIPP